MEGVERRWSEQAPPLRHDPGSEWSPTSLERHWRWWVLLFWLAASAWLLYMRWGLIDAFWLGDTDDNMRIMQVRALIAGQDWFDLRQHRLNPPFGADIHWSRLVDLPLAGIKLALAPFVGGPAAEKAAVALAPLLPMAAAMAAVAAIARRLIAPWAFPVAIAILLCGHSVRNQWAPLRIDHHGWQLALLAVAAASLTDSKRARGGVILGVATALSLVIGLEMLLYLALLGGIAVLMWVRDPAEGRRLATYGASLAGGSALGFLLFASYANRAPVCDALSPVWLSVAAAGGALAVAMAAMAPRTWPLRLGLAAAGGAVLAVGFVLAWPHCLGRLEGASPELVQLWLGNVREARPLYMHGYSTAIAVGALPVTGLIGYAIMLWRDRRDEKKLIAWGATAAPALLAALLLLWQSRAGPAAQLLAVPGATALVWLTVVSRRMPVRVAGTVILFLIASGLLPQQVVRYFPPKPRPGIAVVNKANNSCPTLAALRPVALVPRGQVLTFVDLGPRLIALTHHDAVAGPYHRNGRDIIDVMRAFRGSAEEARATVERRRIDYVLICPGLSESTVYASQARQGFYMQLARGKVPSWLQPVPLPAKSPYKMWRVVIPRS
ncbi:MAG TPA: AcrB/AcrD/AcrF family protein [Allosphingosinicella sp.]|nr:AcrB/AcrD/AcrF family protein [Allosphingosinicella sp.]